MYVPREGFSRRTGSTRRGGSLDPKAIRALAFAALLVSLPACAPALHVGGNAGITHLASVDSNSEMSYIGFISESNDEIVVEEPAIVIEAPSEEPRAAAYARRYGISSELALDIVEHALAAGVDPELGFRLVRVESVFKVSARGPQGALGLTQLMPSTARSLDRQLDTVGEVLDPDANLRTGFRYLRQMIERYDDVRLGLLAYNRGQTAVDRALRRGTDPENGYSHKVLGTRGSNPYRGPGILTADS